MKLAQLKQRFADIHAEIESRDEEFNKLSYRIIELLQEQRRQTQKLRRKLKREKVSIERRIFFIEEEDVAARKMYAEYEKEDAEAEAQLEQDLKDGIWRDSQGNIAFLSGFTHKLKGQPE